MGIQIFRTILYVFQLISHFKKSTYSPIQFRITHFVFPFEFSLNWVLHCIRISAKIAKTEIKNMHDWKIGAFATWIQTGLCWSRNSFSIKSYCTNWNLIKKSKSHTMIRVAYSCSFYFISVFEHEKWYHLDFIAFVHENQLNWVRPSNVFCCEQIIKGKCTSHH